MCLKVLGRLKADKRGSVAIIAALALLMLVIGVGVAVDIGRGQLLKSRMQTAVDAGVLAAAAEAENNSYVYSVTGTCGSDTTSVHYNTLMSNVAQRVINANSGNLLGAVFTASYSLPSLYFVLDESCWLGSSSVDAAERASSGTLVGNGSATLPTTFMALFGVPRITVNVTASATVPTATAAALVVDNSATMGNILDTGTKLASVQTAATGFVNALSINNSLGYSIFLGVVPFSQAVNIGTRYPFMDPSDPAKTSDWGPPSGPAPAVGRPNGRAA
jgi:Flp pilus assembly protein TadG